MTCSRANPVFLRGRWIVALLCTAVFAITGSLVDRSAFHTDYGNTPLWRQLLAGPALAWVLQFIAASIPLMCIARWRLRWDWSQVIFGASVPLLWGLAWWGAFLAAMPDSVTVETLADTMMRAIESRLAGPDWIERGLELTGTCVNPLQLRPSTISTLSGSHWDSVVHGLSSLLNIAFWIVAAHWIPIRRAGGRFGLQEFGRLLVAVLVWTLPMGLRAMAIV